MEILGALIAGTFIGSVLGFVGAGGAMLAVPILIYGFGFEPSVASTSALAVVGSAALSGASAKIKTKQIYYRDAFVIWSIGLVTNLGFSSIVDRLPEDFIAIGFSLVIFFAGLSMLGSPLTTLHKRMSWPVLIGISLLIGSITGLFGIGGGFLVIPVLVLGFGTPHVIAAGTALLVIAINSATALLGHHALWSEVTWNIPIVMGASAVVVAQMASRITLPIADTLLRKLFAYLLFSVATFSVIERIFLA
ncbi:MAG: sulfite exporter TauE/SafE family protein [Candidatus Planktophila sp.]